MGCHVKSNFLFSFFQIFCDGFIYYLSNPGFTHPSLARTHPRSVFCGLVKLEERHICFFVLGWNNKIGEQEVCLFSKNDTISEKPLVEPRSTSFYPNSASTPILCLPSHVFSSSARYSLFLFNRWHSESIRSSNAFLCEHWT